MAGGVTFLCVSVGWVFFRSNDMSSAWNLLRDMAAFGGARSPAIATQQLLSRGLPELALDFLGAGILVWAMPNTRQIGERLESAFRSGEPGMLYRRIVPTAAGVVLALALVGMRRISSFLYFQF
jgi:hypothetical protein